MPDIAFRRQAFGCIPGCHPYYYVVGCMLGLPPAVAFNSEEDILQLSALEIDFHIVLD